MTGEGRLVRDCMVTKIERVTPYVRPVGAMERKRLLRGKLLEEVGEVIDAMFGHGDLVEELGDVLDVVCAIANEDGYCMDDVEKAASVKTHNKGGFNTVLVWRQPEGE